MLKFEEHLAGYDHVIWDWNGTLINDKHICYEVTNDLLAAEGLETITEEHYDEVFCLPIAKFYDTIGFTKGKSTYEQLGLEFWRIYNQKVKTASLHNGVNELLNRIKTEGKTQSILSAALQDHVEHMARHHDIHHLFDHIHCVKEKMPLGKVKEGLELMERTHVAPEKCVFLGDTDHDLEVGDKMGVDVILISNGFQTHDKLTEIHHTVLERLA